MNLIDFIRDVEGCSLKAYDIEGDIAGVDTIGVGHLLTKTERATGYLQIGDQRIRWTNGITQEQADALLAQDLKPFERKVEQYVKVPLSPNQRTALISFCFNVGVGAFQRSTLLKKLNAGDYDSVPYELGRWVKNNGTFIQGLKNRRDKEIALWNS